jgi:hypothetical protein
MRSLQIFKVLLNPHLIYATAGVASGILTKNPVLTRDIRDVNNFTDTIIA